MQTASPPPRGAARGGATLADWLTPGHIAWSVRHTRELMPTERIRSATSPRELPERIDPSLLAAVPERLLAVAADLVISGDTARSGQYLDLLQPAGPSIRPGTGLAARFAALQASRYGQVGHLTAEVGCYVIIPDYDTAPKAGFPVSEQKTYDAFRSMQRRAAITTGTSTG